MVSYMKKMIWGDQSANQAAAASQEERKDGEGESVGPAFSGRVTPDMIVKEGWLYKRSRYLQQWKK